METKYTTAQIAEFVAFYKRHDFTWYTMAEFNAAIAQYFKGWQMRMFEVEFYDTTKRIIFAKNRQEIWKKFSGNIYKIERIVIQNVI